VHGATRQSQALEGALHAALFGLTSQAEGASEHRHRQRYRRLRQQGGHRRHD